MWQSGTGSPARGCRRWCGRCPILHRRRSRSWSEQRASPADFLHLAWAAARYPADVTHEELARAMAWSARALWLGTTQVWELSGLRPATWASFAQSVPTAPTLVEHGLWRAGWRCLNDIDGRAFTPATPRGGVGPRRSRRKAAAVGVAGGG